MIDFGGLFGTYVGPKWASDFHSSLFFGIFVRSEDHVNFFEFLLSFGRQLFQRKARILDRGAKKRPCGIPILASRSSQLNSSGSPTRPLKSTSTYQDDFLTPQNALRNEASKSINFLSHLGGILGRVCRNGGAVVTRPVGQVCCKNWQDLAQDPSQLHPLAVTAAPPSGGRRI